MFTMHPTPDLYANLTTEQRQQLADGPTIPILQLPTLTQLTTRHDWCELHGLPCNGLHADGEEPTHSPTNPPDSSS